MSAISYNPPRQAVRPPGDLFASEVCRQLDITHRQLDYWCGLGWFGARLQGDGSGIPRTFSPADVAKIAAATRMRALGLHMDLVAAALASNRELVLIDQPISPEVERVEVGVAGVAAAGEAGAGRAAAPAGIPAAAPAISIPGEEAS